MIIVHTPNPIANKRTCPIEGITMKSYRLLQFLTFTGVCFSALTNCQPANEPTPITSTENSTAIFPMEPIKATRTPSSQATLQSTASPTPNQTETSPTNAALLTRQPIEPGISLTPAREDMGRIFFHRYQDYGWFDVLATNTSQGLVFDDGDEDATFASPEGPGQSEYIAFSHYSDRVAYWIEGALGELWISDVAYQNPQRILVDSQRSYVPEFVDPRGEIKIEWSPDDLHLFLYDLHQPELSRIFHLETNESEAWHWNCDSIILSSKSGRLATLCPRIASAASEVKEFAILEWGGEIWFSGEYPGEPFLSPLSDGTALWQWSSDGELLAYFDPNDVEGNVFIADKQGNTRKLLPGSSLYRDSEAEGFRQYESLDVLDVDSPFIWAKDASILLVNGFGQPDEPCPPFVTTYDPDLFYAIWPCWQAVDVNTGNIIWIETSLAKNLSLAESERDPVNMAINGLAVEPGGRAIVVQSFYPEPRLVVVNLQTSEAMTISRFDSFNHIYWAAPEN
jgi:hypothetical protein